MGKNEARKCSMASAWSGVQKARTGCPVKSCIRVSTRVTWPSPWRRFDHHECDPTPRQRGLCEKPVLGRVDVEPFERGNDLQTYTRAEATLRCDVSTPGGENATRFDKVFGELLAVDASNVVGFDSTVPFPPSEVGVVASSQDGVHVGFGGEAPTIQSMVAGSSSGLVGCTVKTRSKDPSDSSMRSTAL